MAGMKRQLRQEGTALRGKTQTLSATLPLHWSCLSRHFRNCLRISGIQMRSSTWPGNGKPPIGWIRNCPSSETCT